MSIAILSDPGQCSERRRASELPCCHSSQSLSVKVSSASNASKDATANAAGKLN